MYLLLTSLGGQSCCNKTFLFIISHYLFWNSSCIPTTSIVVSKDSLINYICFWMVILQILSLTKSAIQVNRQLSKDTLKESLEVSEISLGLMGLNKIFCHIKYGQRWGFTGSTLSSLQRQPKLAFNRAIILKRHKCLVLCLISLETTKLLLISFNI